SSRVGGAKKQKKLSSKTAKHINYVFEKKKKADEVKSFNSIKRRKLKEVPSSQFHFICHLKNGEVQSARRGSVSLLRGALPPSGQAQLPWGEVTPNGEATIGESLPIWENRPIGESLPNGEIRTAGEAFQFFPRATIRQDRREKDLKNASALSSIVHLGRNKDICNTYLKGTLINIYHEENHNNVILKMMKELQHTYTYMNSRQISLIIYNLYQYFFTQVVKQIHGKDNPSNYEWYLRLFYVVDDGLFVTPRNKGERYQTDMPVDNSLMRNLLITLSRNVKTYMHCEDDLNTLSRIAFVYSYFCVRDNTLVELLIRKIFQCMHMKKNKKIKYFSLAALAFEKWKLYSVKFMHAYSSLLTKTVDKLTRKGEGVLINREKKKKKKKTKLKHVNLFDVHKKEKKKLSLISLKDILTYLYVLKRNDVKDNNFVERLLRYASLFWGDDLGAQGCTPGECVSLSVNKKKESFNTDTVSQKNKLLTSPAFRSALYANRKRHKNRSNMLTLYALYRISKRAARRREMPLSCFANRVWLHGDGEKGPTPHEEGGESNVPMHNKPVELSIKSWQNDPRDSTPSENSSAFSPADYGPESTVFINKQRTWVSFYKKEVIPMTVFLHHLTRYYYTFLKKKEDFSKLTKLYRDVLLNSDLTNLHFFYTHKIVSVVRHTDDICSNLISTSLYTSAVHKCKRYIALKNAGVFSDVCAQNVCACVVILYIQVLKNKIKDDPLTEALIEFLVKFFSTCQPEQVTHQFLIPPLKLLSMLQCLRVKVGPRDDKRYVVMEAMDKTNGVTKKRSNVDQLPSRNTNNQIDEQKNNVKSNGKNALPSRKTKLQLLNGTILTILKGLNWNNVDNFLLLKSYKYMNRLAGQEKKAKFCMNIVRQKNHLLCNKITHAVKVKVHDFNCEELMKVYLYSGNNFKRKTLLLRNFFTNLLLSNGGIVHRGDNNFFYAVF
ncbi:hypothetical protein PCYB_102880, partial [Plasmodium cynomolgi strain B]